MAMTKKNYQAFADLMYEALQTELPAGAVNTPEQARQFLLGYITAGLESIFERDNERFDSKRFRDWCHNGTDK